MRLPCSRFLAVFLTSFSSLAAAPWIDLYNGHDLSGWHQVAGTASFKAEGETIVGETTLDSPNSFLATDAPHGDFELEFEVRMEKGKTFNSGVQFRSAVRDEKGSPRVFGYQCEIDPSARGWSAGLYDEAGRGWLYPVTLNPPALNRFIEGEWNHYRIQACGNDLRTWLNGTPVAHVIDAASASGFIALQVHAIGKDNALAGHRVAWKNLRLRPITPAEISPCPVPFVRNLVPNDVSPDEALQGWRLLWNGRDTQGWRGAKSPDFPSAGWEIKDGVLSVLASEGKESVNGGDIITVERFSNFEVQLDFRISEGANSGLKYFVQPALNQAGGSAIGLEFQVLDDAKHPDALLGKNGNRTVASLYDLIPADTAKPKVLPGEWHHARVVSKGDHVEHWLDGRKVVDYRRGTPEFHALVAESKYKIWPGFGDWADGHLLLQDHGNFVSYRSIKVRTSTPQTP